MVVLRRSWQQVVALRPNQTPGQDSKETKTVRPFSGHMAPARPWASPEVFPSNRQVRRNDTLGGRSECGSGCCGNTSDTTVAPRVDRCGSHETREHLAPHILTVGVVDQAGQVGTVLGAGPDAHLQGVEGEFGVEAGGDL